MDFGAYNNDITLLAKKEIIAEVVRRIASNLVKAYPEVSLPPFAAEDIDSLAGWISTQVSYPNLRYQCILNADDIPYRGDEGWQGLFSMNEYGDLYRMRYRFQTNYTPAETEITNFIGNLPSGTIGIIHNGSWDLELYINNDGVTRKIKPARGYKFYGGGPKDKVGMLCAQAYEIIAGAEPPLPEMYLRNISCSNNLELFKKALEKDPDGYLDIDELFDKRRFKVLTWLLSEGWDKWEGSKLHEAIIEVDGKEECFIEMSELAKKTAVCCKNDELELTKILVDRCAWGWFDEDDKEVAIKSIKKLKSNDATRYALKKLSEDDTEANSEEKEERRQNGKNRYR